MKQIFKFFYCYKYSNLYNHTFHFHLNKYNDWKVSNYRNLNFIIPKKFRNLYSNNNYNSQLLLLQWGWLNISNPQKNFFINIYYVQNWRVELLGSVLASQNSLRIPCGKLSTLSSNILYVNKVVGNLFVVDILWFLNSTPTISIHSSSSSCLHKQIKGKDLWHSNYIKILTASRDCLCVGELCARFWTIYNMLREESRSKTNRREKSPKQESW